MPDQVREILQERGPVHGEFTEQARVSQDLHNIMRASPNWHKLRPYMQEALSLIATKISRILTGDFMFLDHWHDLVGYGTLVVDRVKEYIKSKGDKT